MLGPAKKKYRVQVEGLTYQLEYYPAALGLPELTAHGDVIPSSGDSFECGGGLQRATAPAGFQPIR